MGDKEIVVPLHDHFRSPMLDELPWSGFHSRWAIAIADDLNDRLLSPRYRASALIPDRDDR